MTARRFLPTPEVGGIRAGESVIFAWNEYGEQAIIEPSFGGPAPVKYDYVEKARLYYEQFLRLLIGEDAGVP